MQLLGYQKEIYNYILNKFESSNKVAVIMATGTGKSFIILKWLKEHKGKRILVCSSSIYIFKQLKRYAANEIDFFHRVECLTYAKVFRMEDEEILNLRFDYVVLDEFHRAGATMWGEGIQNLLRLCPDAKILGTTATPIRTLDNERNMAEELFDNNIAYELSFEEAVIRDILPKFDYITAIYSYNEELDVLQQRFEKCRNSSIKVKLKNAIEELRRQIGNADGLEEIFYKYLKHRTNAKFVVFCRNKEHLIETERVIDSWFSKVNSNIAKYCVMSELSSSDSQLEGFINDNRETHLKILLSIDKVNEGIHVGDIDGVIMLRTTGSNIVYKQQMGRAFSAKVNDTYKRPLVFDLVNNFSNPFVKNMEKDFEKAYIEWNQSDTTNAHKFHEKQYFRIYDETIEIKKLFEHVKQMYDQSWEKWKQLIQQYYDEYGTIIMPKSYVVDGCRLGRYIDTLRRYKERHLESGYFTIEDVEWLESLGYVWNPYNVRWNEFKRYALKYYNREGHLNVPKRHVEDGYKLGTKIVAIRKRAKEGIRPDSQYAYLNDSECYEWLNNHGMLWDVKDKMWNDLKRAVDSYYLREGNLNVPSDHIENGYRLGDRIARYRSALKKGNLKLSIEQINYLENKGMVWDYLSNENEQFMKHMRDYYNDYGDLQVYVTHKVDGYNLGTKVLYYREHKSSLKKEDINWLDSRGFIWDIQSKRLSELMEAADSYYKREGNLAVPVAHIENGYRLGAKLARYRNLYKANEIHKYLTDDMIDWLESRNMVWNMLQYKAEKRIQKKHE